MFNRLALFAGLLTAVVFVSSSALAHCQVPCGIYDDDARHTAMLEDANTIEKAMKHINELAPNTDGQSANQVVRWVNTKEEHATRIIDVISVYFLTQKLKPVAEGADGRTKYLARLEAAHGVMKAAMKTKQTVDTSNVEALRNALKAFHSAMK